MMIAALLAGLPVPAGAIKESEIMDQAYGNEKTGAIAAGDDRKRRMEGGRRMHCGVLLILIGMFWLSTSAGWIPGDLFCPLAMILIGLWSCIPFVWSRIKGTS
jgi:hypothetical protein